MTCPFKALMEYVLLVPARMVSLTSMYVPFGSNRIGKVPRFLGNGVDVKTGNGGGVSVGNSELGSDVDVVRVSGIRVRGKSGGSVPESGTDAAGVITSTSNEHAERLISKKKNKNLYRMVCSLSII
jgi:hypothetical protein